MNQLLNHYSAEVQRILAKYPPEVKRSAVMPLTDQSSVETARASSPGGSGGVARQGGGSGCAGASA